MVLLFWKIVVGTVYGGVFKNTLLQACLGSILTHLLASRIQALYNSIVKLLMSIASLWNKLNKMKNKVKKTRTLMINFSIIFSL